MSDEMAQQFQRQVDSFCSSHPLVPISLEDNGVHARRDVIGHFLSMLESRATLHLGLCPYCEFDRKKREDAAIQQEAEGLAARVAAGLPDEITPTARVPEKPKAYKFNLSAHMWRCETSRLGEKYERCYFCGLFILKGPDATSHFEDCYVNAIVAMYERDIARKEEGKPPQYVPDPHFCLHFSRNALGVSRRCRITSPLRVAIILPTHFVRYACLTRNWLGNNA